jgi:Amiloride-sensitive sodium channel
LANCGGLLGLWLGVSAISLVEIAYFCIMRLWKHEWVTTTGVEEFRRSHNGANRFRKIVEDLMNEYFNKTTIQGVKYPAESSLTLIERIWWLVVVGISVFCCGCFIADVFRRYDETPVTISYVNEETPVSYVEKIFP